MKQLLLALPDTFTSSRETALKALSCVGIAAGMMLWARRVAKRAMIKNKGLTVENLPRQECLKQLPATSPMELPPPVPTQKDPPNTPPTSPKQIKQIKQSFF